MNQKNLISSLIVSIAIAFAAVPESEAKPLKVYILVGQSNMQGMAMQSTLPYMAADPATKALHDKILDKDGKPRVYKNVHMAAFSGSKLDNLTDKSGPLTLGYGRRLTEDSVFGPELGFGITLHEHLDEPILIIKTSWGGLDLHTCYRPPSAGPYELPETTRKAWARYPDGAHGVPSEADRPAWFKKKSDSTGLYYKWMMARIDEVLSDPGKYCDVYDAKEGYEMAGLVWFQGWNDMVDRTTYPHGVENRFQAYTDVLAHFIRDVRKELKAPKMPVVIGVMGVGGSARHLAGKPGTEFRHAMAAPAAMPEFKGNVFAVETGEYWDFDVDHFATFESKCNSQAKNEWKEEAAKTDLTKLDDKERHQHRLKGMAQVKDRTRELVVEKYGEEKYASLKAAKANAHYHYLGCGKVMARIGEGFANALLKK